MEGAEFLHYPPDQHQAWLAIGDPVAVAYEWIVAYLKNINEFVDRGGDNYVTFYELINTAKSHLDDEYGDYIIRGGAFEGFQMDLVFWDKLAILLNREIPQSARTTIFSCSC